MILLYHNVFPDSIPNDQWISGPILRESDFQKHLIWLNKHFQIVPLDDYLLSRSGSQRKISITFDDGYKQAFNVVFPFLAGLQVPATFFVNTQHLRDGDLYWFSYLNALCYEKKFNKIVIGEDEFSLKTRAESIKTRQKLGSLARLSGDPIAFTLQLSSRYTLNKSTYFKYEGLSLDQIRKISQNELLSVGGHTVTHPYLDQLSFNAQKDEMLVNKQDLEEICGNNVSYFAYPSGVYNADSLQAVKEVGFRAAFAVNPRHLKGDDVFQISRAGVYSPSLYKLALKTYGGVKLLRKFGFKIG